jgi:hypothetical protein
MIHYIHSLSNSFICYHFSKTQKQIAGFKRIGLSLIYFKENGCYGWHVPRQDDIDTNQHFNVWVILSKVLCDLMIRQRQAKRASILWVTFSKKTSNSFYLKILKIQSPYTVKYIYKHRLMPERLFI